MISIIIPVYNHAKELQQCLASIAAQTYKNYEVIVIDDGSDEAIPIIRNHPNDPNNSEHSDVSSIHSDRVLFLRQEHQGGSESAQRARNLGFRYSKGEYLMFCDADVIMQPTMLDKMLGVLSTSYKLPPTTYQLAYAYSGFRLGYKAMPSFPFSADRLRKMPYIHTTSLIRREAFPGWDESIKKFQDWDLYLTLLKNGYTGIWIPELLYTILPRRTHGISLWLPGFMYKMPWSKFGIHIGAIERYHEGMKVIGKKYSLV